MNNSTLDEIQNNVYTPKNILITGGAGFIASHMVIHLVNKYPDYNIYNLDKLDYCSSLKYLESLETKPNYKFIKGNILSEDLIMFILQSYNIDTIMHFAAQSHVDNSFGNSFDFTQNNVLGTHILLECAKVYGIKRFVHISTDEVYGETAYKDGTLEESILCPTNPYSASKAGAEHLVFSYLHSFKLSVIVTRSNNIYGPHQYPEKVIPKFISRLSRGLPCCLHGEGKSKRSFLFVLDVVSAYDTILHQGVVGEIYNIGASDELTMKELAYKLIQLFEYEDTEKYIEYTRDRAFNDLRYHINGDKVTQLGWSPKVSFDEGLKITKDWYLSIDINHVWNENAESALKPHPQK